MNRSGKSLRRARISMLCAALALAGIAPAFAQDTTINTIAGTGNFGYSGDGGPAPSAQIRDTYDTAVDAQGNLYLADLGNHRIRRIDAATGIITTFAGTGAGGYNGDGIPATSAQIYSPLGVTLDAAGNLYFTEYFGGRVRRVDAVTGLISTVAGNGARGGSPSGNGGPASAANLGDIRGIAVDAAGNLYIASYTDSQIRRVDAATGIIDFWLAGRFWNLALDSDGYLYGADLTNASRVLRINTVDRTTTLLAGGGSDAGEGVPALTASLQGVWGVDTDAAGNVLIVESERHRVRRVDAATGLINTVAGTGVSGYGGDGGPALQAQFTYPTDVEAVGPAGAIIADYNTFRVRAFGIAPSTSADLSVTATAADEQVRVGETLGYGVTVANAGPDAAESTGVGFALDAELRDLQVQAPEGWSCDEPSVGEGTTLASCNASELASEESADFTVTATAPASASGRSVTLTAAATSRTSDPDEENNSDSASIGVTPVADVSVTLEGPRKVAFGAKAKYVVTVANAGPSVAPDPVVVLASDMSARSVALQVPEGWNCARGESTRFTAYCVAQSGELGGERPAFTLTVGSSGQLSASSFTVGAEAYSEASDPVPSNNARSLKAFRYAFSY